MHITIPDALFYISIAALVGTAMHLIALKLAAHGWKKTAYAIDALATWLINLISFARKVARASGQDLPMMTLDETVTEAAKRSGIQVKVITTQPTPPRGNAGRVSLPHLAWSAMIAFAAMCIVALLALSHTGCASSSDQTSRRAFAGTIASQGVITEGMIHANRDIYTQATNTLGARVQGADYAREVVPLNLAFDARSRALQALSADLYGSAALVNATRGDGGFAAYIPAAQTLLDAIQRDLAVLREGSILPAIPIPTAVDAIVGALQGIVGAVH